MSAIDFLAFLALIVPILIAVAYLTLSERKILATVQKRIGPNVVGIFGLLQPFADALKLLLKENLTPAVASKKLFMLAPVLTFGLAILNWLVLPFDEFAMFLSLELSSLYVLAISSLAVYGIILAGWASNSKYAFFGSMRSAAQMISYEISMGLVLLNLFVTVGTFNLVDIALFQRNVWLIIPFLPAYVIFMISILAETNRPPFDLPEAEAELVAGYSVEYSSAGFALFFIAEYANIIFMNTVAAIVFCGAWLSPLGQIKFFLPFLPIGDGFVWLAIKAYLSIVFFILVRASFPRYRYDQLMQLGWKIFLPVTTLWLMVNILILVNLNAMPHWLN